MPKIYQAVDVFDAAYDRYRQMYDHGDRVVVSCSGGKDSTVCVEMAILAARDAGRLPVEVVMRDEEIMLPGTFEYCERLANRTDEVDFHWVMAGQPIVNIFNRFAPYFWVFDKRVEPDDWVRKWPGFDRGDGPETTPLKGRQPYWTDEQFIQTLCTAWRFPPLWPDEWFDLSRDKAGEFHWTGKSRDPEDPWVGHMKILQGAPMDTVDKVTGLMYCGEDRRGSECHHELGKAVEPGRIWSVLGLRTQESPRRLMGLMVRDHWGTRAVDRYGIWGATPIYDWTDGDVWKFIKDYDLDYDHAYDVMRRMGIPKQRMRIAPPTLTHAGIAQMQVASKAWPQWFDRVAARLDGVRTVAQFGRRAVQPSRRLGETWQECFYREIIDAENVPRWIKERALFARDYALSAHGHHSSAELPDASNCPECTMVKCWSALTTHSYNGDPFGMQMSFLKPLEPEFFREGAGSWGGDVAFV